MPSEREYQQARERRAWIAEEARKQREAEDREEYIKYVNELESQQRQSARAERIEPLTFEKWRRCIPEELKDAPASLRGAAASLNSNTSRILNIAFDRLKNGELTDEELHTLGFDPDDRVLFPEAQLSQPVIVDVFNRFADREPRYVRTLHFEPIADFLSRNKLVPSERHVALTFNHLLGIGALSQPEPEPEPAKPSINLQIEPDPELEAQKRREKYEREIVVIDPETQKGWTAYQLDYFADSETYRRLMRIPRVYKNPALEPQH